MLGTYIAYSLRDAGSAARSASGAAIVPRRSPSRALGALIEIVLLRRIYRAPELFQLLATFALVLVINDAALWLWGPEDLLGPRAPGLRGAIEILGRRIPELRPVSDRRSARWCWSCCMLLLRARAWAGWCAPRPRTARWSARSASTSRCCSPRCLRSARRLPGSAARCRCAREPANLAMDLIVIGDAFVVVVVGGMGSIPGAYVAALLIAEVKALCIGLGVVASRLCHVNFSKLTLVAEFVVMALVLIARPYGLLGRPQGAVRVGRRARSADPLRPPGAVANRRRRAARACCCVPLLAQDSPYALVLGIDVLIAVLFAASLHFITGPGGMHSFGHAAYFGLGAYGAALLVKWLAASDGPGACRSRRSPPLAGALLFGWFAVRLSGVYLAMLTLAFAQIVWAIVFQWEDAHRRLQRRDRRLADARLSTHAGAYYLLTLAPPRSACCSCGGCCSRRSVTRCAPAAIPRCAPRPSASTSSACIGSASRSPAPFAASPAGCSPLPRARSRPKSSTSAAPSTGS